MASIVPSRRNSPIKSCRVADCRLITLCGKRPLVAAIGAPTRLDGRGRLLTPPAAPAHLPSVRRRTSSRHSASTASAKATEQPLDTGTATGKAFLDMLGVFAEFETTLRKERQLEGIAAAKARGVYKGRKPSIGAAEVRRLN